MEESERRRLRREGVLRMKEVALACVRGEALGDAQPTEGDEAYTFAIQCVLDAIGTVDEVMIDEMCGDDYQRRLA